MTTITTALPTPAHSVNGSSIPTEMIHDVVMTEDSPQKRKRPLEDVGDQEQKKVHIEDSSLDIQNLHLDVGHKYLVCKTRKAPFHSHCPQTCLRSRENGSSLLLTVPSLLTSLRCGVFLYQKETGLTFSFLCA